jgi:hypothetical protein
LDTEAEEVVVILVEDVKDDEDADEGKLVVEEEEEEEEDCVAVEDGELDMVDVDGVEKALVDNDDDNDE